MYEKEHLMGQLVQVEGNIRRMSQDQFAKEDQVGHGSEADQWQRFFFAVADLLRRSEGRRCRIKNLLDDQKLAGRWKELQRSRLIRKAAVILQVIKDHDKDKEFEIVVDSEGQSRARSVVLRVATALMCTLATLLLTATRALAAAATKSAAATVGPAITGDMIKWGGVGLLCAGVFMAGGKSNTASSGFEYVEEEETGFAAGAGSLEARPVDDDDAETPSSSPFDGVSDSAFSSALSARMEALSSGKGDEDAEKPPEPPKDDTGYNGSTGLMERPKPSDVPSVDKGAVDDFPVGFPLRDFEPEDVDVAPAASADDIAMLARMFGTSEPSKDD